MANFVRAANPIWFFVDLVGEPLTDEYYISFLTNTFPYLPQAVYQDVNGTIPWANPLEFEPNGTLPDNLYFNDQLVYRLEIRRGPTQNDALIYEINNFVPSQSGGITPENLDISAATNQFSNPQFSQINFASPTTITTAGTYEIAPGWDLVLTGAGSTTLEQIILSGNTNGDLVGSPPFALEISNSGWTTAILQQTFENNGALFANGAIAVGFLGRANTTSENVTVNYIQSDSGTQLPLNNLDPATLTTAQFQQFNGYLNVPASTNTDLSSDATTTIQFVLPVLGEIQLTNMQLVGQSIPLPVDFNVVTQSPNYNQESSERNVDQLFHYYKPGLDFKPINSLLVGWDFKLNPAQWGSTQTITTTPAYIWDQTIAASASNNFSVLKNVVLGFLEIQPTVNDDAFYLMQYLTLPEIYAILNSDFSVNIHAWTGLGTAADAYTVQVHLYRAPSTSSIPTLPTSIGTIDTDGNFSISAAGWTEIPRGLLGDAKALVPAITNPSFPSSPEQDIKFSGWQITDPTQEQNTVYFAIVVTFKSQNTIPIGIDSISLVPGSVPTRPAPQTVDQVLRQCQYYYEKSYPIGVNPGTATFQNAYRATQLVSGSAPVNMHPGSFTLDFKTVKRSIPIITIYRPRVGTSDFVDSYLYNGGTDVADGATQFSINWTVANPTTGLSPNSVDNAIFYAASTNVLQTDAGASSTPEGFILFQYTVDSRLGVV